MTNNEWTVASAAPTLRRAKSTTTGTVMAILGIVACLPQLAFCLMWAMVSLADGSVEGAVLMAAAGIISAPVLGLLFFAIGFFVERRGHRHQVVDGEWPPSASMAMRINLPGLVAGSLSLLAAIAGTLLIMSDQAPQYY